MEHQCFVWAEFISAVDTIHPQTYSKVELFPMASFGTSNVFVCVFCTSIFGFVERMKKHIGCLHASETWTSPKASFGTTIRSNAKYALAAFSLMAVLK